MQDAVGRWMSGQVDLQAQGLPISDDLALRIIRATDVSRPDGAVPRAALEP